MRNNLPNDLFQPPILRQGQTNARAEALNNNTALTDNELKKFMCFLFIMYLNDVSAKYRLNINYILSRCGLNRDLYKNCRVYLIGRNTFCPFIHFATIQRINFVFPTVFNQTKYLNTYANYCNNDVKMALDSYKIEFI